MSGFQDLVEGGHYWSVLLLYVGVPRLGGGWALLISEVTNVGVPRLGGGWALLVSVVTICRGSKTWWRVGIIDQCGYYMSGFKDLVEGGHY